MFEKVNPSHPDKIADRIAGAIVDIAYGIKENPKIAVEVLIGHGMCTVIAESNLILSLKQEAVEAAIKRIGGNVKIRFFNFSQDSILENNQKQEVRCGDNGIFKGVPLEEEELELSRIAREIYSKHKSDGKYIIDNGKLTICQSKASSAELKKQYNAALINPLGYWTGGIDVDTGATNRKLGSDMAQGVTGGGLHGKDLSKADVSVNIYAFIKAQTEKNEIKLSCSIGDEFVDGVKYSEIVEIARTFIKEKGGFEKFAEWGLF